MVKVKRLNSSSNKSEYFEPSRNHQDFPSLFIKIPSKHMHNCLLQISQLEPKVVEDNVAKTEFVVINDLLKYAALTISFCLPAPRKIRYDPLSRRFLLCKSSYIRQILCIICQCLILLRMLHKVSPLSKETSQGILSSVTKGTYIVFLFHCLILFTLLWTKLQGFVNIMNQAIDLSSELSLRFIAPPKSRLVHFASLSSWIFPLIFCICAHFLPGSIAIIYYAMEEKNSLASISGYENISDVRFSLNEFNSDYPIFIKVLLVTSNFLNTFSWMMSFLHVGIWALIFRHLFLLFLWKFDALLEQKDRIDLSNEIRTFNNICNLVEHMNEIIGLHVLCGSIVSVLYISTSIEQAFSGVQGVAQISFKAHLYLSYVPIIAAILMVSDLHRVASSFGNKIKYQFGKSKNATNFTNPANLLHSSEMFEAVQGIIIVHHDIVTSNIGFKGLGFFTITYKFAATMLSLVVTYALTAIQMFPLLKSANAK